LDTLQALEKYFQELALRFDFEAFQQHFHSAAEVESKSNNSTQAACLLAKNPRVSRTKSK
jgi:hypothetical protein